MFSYKLLRGYPTAFMLPVVLTGLLLAAPAQATHPPSHPPFSVNDLTDAVDATPGDGKCEAFVGGNAVCTLRAAVQEANALMTAATPPNITIALPVGTFTLTGPGNEDNAASGDLDIVGTCPSLSINDPCITIQGNTATGTIIDGGGIDRVFHIIGKNTVKITGITIRNGNAIADSGGGIRNAAGWVTLEDCVIDNNKAGSTAAGKYGGGGIYNGETAQMIINRCEVINNEVMNYTTQAVGGLIGGGGIFNNGTMTITQTTLRANQGRPFGAGILNTSGLPLASGKLTISESIIESNINLISSGGGLANAGGASVITRTIIRLNEADDGAGILNVAGTNKDGTVSGNVRLNSSVVQGNLGQGILNQGSLDVLYSTISSNRALESSGPDGGGILNRAPGTMTISNSTITGNRASRNGGGISNGRAMELTNVTISGNISGQSSQGGFGDEVFLDRQDTNQDRAVFRNTIIGNNTNSTRNCASGVELTIIPIVAGSGVVTSSGNNLEHGNTCGFAVATGDIINTTPNLGPLTVNGNPAVETKLLDNSYPLTLMPQPGSAAVGKAVCVNTFDQRLYGRPGADGECDIGAVETDGDPSVGKVDLEVAVTGNTPNVSLNNPVTYTLVVTNKGPGVAQGVTLTAQIPGGTTYLPPIMDSGNPVVVTCSTSTIGSGRVSCSLSPTTPDLASGASFTVFITVTPVNDSLNNTSIEMRTRVDVASPNDYLPGNNGSLTACVSGACVLTLVKPITNIGSNNGGGAFGLFELLFLAAAPGALVLRRRITR